MLKVKRQLIVVAATACLATGMTAAQAQNLTLTIDPYSGATTISNSSMATAIPIDAYQITSASGSLLPNPAHTAGAGWDSLAHQGLAGWEEVSPTTNGLSELNLSSATTIPAGGSLFLGNAFNAADPHDVSWGYNGPGTGNTEVTTNPAPVLYAGGLQVQVISTLNSSGSVTSVHAMLVNQESTQSFTFDAYAIQSASGSLNPAGFTGYSSQGVAGWESVAPSANGLSELNLTGSSTLAPGQAESLGTAFTIGAAHDLTLQFHLLNGTGPAPNGTVAYSAALAGDANHDGIVNSQDLALVSSNWLQSHSLPGDVNYDGIVNSQDLALISSNWLSSMAVGQTSATAVPEPACLGLLGIGGLFSLCLLRSPRRAVSVTRPAPPVTLSVRPLHASSRDVAG